MNRVVRQWGPFLLDRLGLPGMLGVVLLLAALAGQFVVVRLIDGQSRVLAAQVSAAARAGASGKDRRSGLAASGRIEPADKVPDNIAALFAAAGAAGLTLHNGSYHLVYAKDSGLGQYQVVLPIEGAYPAVRDFLDKALAQPALALDSLKLSRDSVEDDTLKAEVHVTLFLERKP